MRFICPRLRLSKETHTQIHVFFLLCCPAMFGSLAPSPRRLLQNGEPLASAKGRRPLPRGKTRLAPGLIAEKTALVRAGLASPKGRTAGKQQAACDSSAAPESKTHLSSPEESRRFPRTWRETRSLRGGWKAGWISRTIFHGHDGEFDEKKRNPSVGDSISAGF